jgi:hypothetical protein
MTKSKQHCEANQNKSQADRRSGGKKVWRILFKKDKEVELPSAIDLIKSRGCYQLVAHCTNCGNTQDIIIPKGCRVVRSYTPAMGYCPPIPLDKDEIRGVRDPSIGVCEYCGCETLRKKDDGKE